jgi:hypothetical protein
MPIDASFQLIRIGAKCLNFSPAKEQKAKFPGIFSSDFSIVVLNKEVEFMNKHQMLDNLLFLNIYYIKHKKLYISQGCLSTAI